ncbi:MAG: TrmH family RNA methyltransferase [Acidimicrobiia bacterium]
MGDETIGVGPHAAPWPTGDQYDAELLEHGDTRNVLDRYRYWTREAIVEDLDLRRHGFHVVIENWQHDFNIGTVVRNANAFLANTVHIVGKKRWNRRGAMVTDRYQHIEHHPDVEAFAAWATAKGLPVVGIDIVPGSTSLEDAVLPQECILAFGQEGPGLSAAMQERCSDIHHITQYGSTRSINVGVASGIAMNHWCRLHAAA